ncbi:MAG: YqaE/Pmp3 family membrane protein [Opitutales bacterium]|nr:YqaE/Pmp3 family membrane protein [Opitutales bacterium]
MSCTEVLLVFIFPPLAVIDKGCDAFFITLFATSCGWLPGVMVALLYCSEANNTNRD